MKLFKILFLIIPCVLIARKGMIPSAPSAATKSPWFTGPLLSPPASVVPLGHVNYEPYFFATANTGFYDRNWHAHNNSSKLWNFTFQPVLEIGTSLWSNIAILPTLNYNHTEGAGKWTFGDFPINFAFRLYAPKTPYGNAPYVKLHITETLPTGKYRNLDPQKKGTDISGQGSFSTAVGLVFGQFFHLTKAHILSTRLFVEYEWPAPVKLKGLNAYGGGFGTNARLFPPQVFSIDASIELSLSQNWAFACDAVGTWQTKTHFSGERGVNAQGHPASLGSGSSAQFSLAPALEYNWSANLGIIGGCWFTIAGRNINQFYSGVFAINYYH